MMLPSLLVSILEGALNNGATHVEIGRDEVVLFRGAKRLGAGALPPDTFAHLGTVLRGNASMTSDATDGHAVFHGPSGPVEVDVHFTAESIRLVFSPDGERMEAERTVNAALAEGARIGATHIVIRAEGIALFEKEAMVGVSPCNVTMRSLVAHVRRLGTIGADTSTGQAVVFGPHGPSTLMIELANDAITLRFLSPKSDG